MNDEEQATFMCWLARQPRDTEAGKLSMLLFADLAAARVAPCPSSLREVQEWAVRRPGSTPRLRKRVADAARLWKQWLRTTPASPLASEVAE